jgi:bifunctional DNA-binding transcriptional regulator/antitoxin component of YhaV-PrlF toxin-antitoxin module
VDIRRRHNIEEGGKVEIVEEDGKIVIRRKVGIMDLAGVDAGKSTPEELNRLLDEMRKEDEGQRRL